ncbi:MAG TPA: hypothetical protein PLU37_09665 [Chitinophagaceae bacterium]|nr:hypothetical protein [Chitinophagaceae bacterium]MCB9056035.1 hypothetical protein [Chitinophagales bacterium]HPG11786.1 hypothetical protein [Chitinophagaceae bacterium]
MKKIFTLSIVSLAVFVFSSCSRDYYYDGGFDESYWLSKEAGEVVYSDSYCNYYVVETYYGYTIIRSTGYKPYEGSLVYGNFSNLGTREFYNRSSGFLFTGAVTDYWLSYTDAQYALDYYCPLYGKGVTREFKKATIQFEKK